MGSSSLGVAVAQGRAVPGDVSTNLRALAELVVRAHDAGADLVVTPELFATGYHPATAWTHDADAIRTALSDLARRTGVALVASTVDSASGPVDDAPGAHHISSSFFAPDGVELARVRKRHLYRDDERRYFSEGDGYGEPVEWAGVVWGLGTCYDLEFPELARDQARRGAQVLLVPTAVPVLEDAGPPGLEPPDLRDLDYSASLTSTLQVPARALDNGLYVAYANHCGPGFTGRSCIATPMGRNTALLSEEHEDVAVARIYPDAVAHARRLNTYLSDAPPAAAS